MNPFATLLAALLATAMLVLSGFGALHHARRGDAQTVFVFLMLALGGIGIIVALLFGGDDDE